MIESPARITRIENDRAWVISEAPSSCGACAGKGCGSSVFNRLWHPDSQEFLVANPIGAAPGEAVVIGLPDGSLMRATAIGYLLPLAALFLGALLGKTLAGDPGAAVGGLLGLALVGLGLKWLRPAAGGNTVEPTILRRGSPQCASSTP